MTDGSVIVPLHCWVLINRVTSAHIIITHINGQQQEQQLELRMDDDGVTDSQLAAACDIYEQLCEPADSVLVDAYTVRNDDMLSVAAEAEWEDDIFIAFEHGDNTLLDAAVQLEAQQPMVTNVDGKQ